MKIYIPFSSPTILRINIKKQKTKTQFITICECTQKECYEYIKDLIEKQNISPFQTGSVTNIEIRIGIGGINGKSISLSFRGLEPIEVYELITNSLKLKKYQI